MKRMVGLALAAGLSLAGANVYSAAAAHSGGPARVATTLYFHGQTPAGEAEEATGIVDGTFMSMDTTPPGGDQPKSKSLGWANTKCAGNRGFLVWSGALTGKVVGDLKISFSSVSPAQDVDIRVWPDVTQVTCDADYPYPSAQKTVTLPQGQGEVKVTLRHVDVFAHQSLMVQISPTASLGTDTPGPGRILYDSTTTPSKIDLTCIPSGGHATCT